MTEARYVDDGERYRLDSWIATGGMGEVWRGTDTMLGRTVAVKLLKPEYADDALFRSRFAAEARHAASLHHPGIASVFDLGEARPLDGARAPRPYLVMELVDGQPLSALLHQGEPLDPAATAALLAQAADAIGAAHAKGIVHRDVKPANLLVTPDRRIKITDFGIARATEGLSLTQSGQVMGTPSYISPEQASGQRATAASDVYSLGVVAFECLAGRRPFVRETAVATALAHVREPMPPLPPEVPAGLAAVVLRSLAKDPAHRYRDGAAFAAALRDPEAAQATAAMTPPVASTADPTGATAVLTMGAPPPETLVGAPAYAVAEPDGPEPDAVEPAASEPSRRRSRRWWWLVGVLLAAALAILVWRLQGGEEDPTEPEPSEPTTQTPSETATSEAPAGVQLTEADYVGRPMSQVSAELTALGLRVSGREVANPGDQQEGIVTGVSPSGALDAGELVTVSYWGAPVEPTEEPTTEPSEPTTEPTPEPTEDPADGGDEGSGADGSDAGGQTPTADAEPPTAESTGGLGDGGAIDGQR